MTPIELTALLVIAAIFVSYAAIGIYELCRMDPDDERWEDIADMWEQERRDNRFEY